ncbi:MAG: aldehyde dehydrogenase family protein, partial [Gemmatimonadetes bacterium]|nr:aldehyde dehydrogenase family protein [Gemmatimonadota bacterium]
MQVSTQVHPNEARAKGFIARYREEGIGHLIGGSSVLSAGGATFENASPIDHSVLCNVASGGPEEVDAAARAATEAFVDWRDTTGSERKRLLHRVADLIEENGEEIALLETCDTGQPIRFMSKAATRAAENFRFFADRAETASDGLALPTAGHLNYTQRQPIGPVGIITPWNTPFMLSTWK